MINTVAITIVINDNRWRYTAIRYLKLSKVFANLFCGPYVGSSLFTLSNSLRIILSELLSFTLSTTKLRTHLGSVLYAPRSCEVTNHHTQNIHKTIVIQVIKCGKIFCNFIITKDINHSNIYNISICLVMIFCKFWGSGYT